jgi:hypothetical protein
MHDGNNLMGHLLQSLLGIFYDVIVVCQTFQKQLENRRKMPQRNQGLHLKLKFEKLQLLQKV